jgi:GlpG protein
MHRAIKASAAQDLRPFVGFLQAQRFAHHVTEESGAIVIWARSEEEAALIAGLFHQWQSGELDLPQMHESGHASMPALFSVKALLQGLLRAAWVAPLSLLLIAACLLVAVISKLGADPASVRFLFFPDIAVHGSNPLLSLFTGVDSLATALRLLTPALLHFGPIHLVFNLLWLWYFGRMMEPVLSLWRYALIIAVTALCANVLQYLWAGHGQFGGMSGVVYGQIGFIWMWQSLHPGSAVRLPQAMIVVFLVALVLMEVLASSLIATAAHVGGLISGMLLGLGFGFVFSDGKKSTTIK